MLRFLPGLLALVVAIYSLVDCVQTPDEQVRGLPKLVWVFVILLFPFVGSAGWWLAGRPSGPTLPGRSAPSDRPRTRPPGPNRPSGPKGPDDDPDFLRGL